MYDHVHVYKNEKRRNKEPIEAKKKRRQEKKRKDLTFLARDKHWRGSVTGHFFNVASRSILKQKQNDFHITTETCGQHRGYSFFVWPADVAFRPILE